MHGVGGLLESLARVIPADMKSGRIEQEQHTKTGLTPPTPPQKGSDR